jgi:hypothetical protein
MKSTNPRYLESAVPMMMLGGSPTMVAVPPMFENRTWFGWVGGWAGGWGLVNGVGGWGGWVTWAKKGRRAHLRHEQRPGVLLAQLHHDNRDGTHQQECGHVVQQRAHKTW